MEQKENSSAVCSGLRVPTVPCPVAVAQRMPATLVLALLVPYVMSSMLLAGIPQPTTSSVFTPGESGYPTFRIPGTVVTNSGTVLAFAEGRVGGSGVNGNVDLVMKRSLDGGQTWQALQVVANDGGNTTSNPTPVVDRNTGTIFLPYTRWLGNESIIDLVTGNSTESVQIWLTKSTDDGATWDAPANITSQVKDPSWGWYTTGPGAGLQMRNGRLVIPGYHIPISTFDSEQIHISHAFYSDDGGSTWQQGGSIESYDPSTEPGWHTPGRTDESSVVELMDGRLLLNMRSYHNDFHRAIAYSSDGGQNWGPVTLHDQLFDPNVQASVLRYTDTVSGFDTNRVLFSNPTGMVPSGNRFVRENMGIRISYDEGATWPVTKVVEPGMSAYSQLTVLPDNTIGLLYEKGPQFSETITFGRYTLEFLTNGLDSLTGGPLVSTVINFANMGTAGSPNSDRLVPSDDGQFDGGADNTFGSFADSVRTGIFAAATPNIAIDWGRSSVAPSGSNSDHWIAVGTSGGEAFFTPNGSGNLNQRTAPITLTAGPGFMVQLHNIDLVTGANTGSSSQSKLYVDGGLQFDTGVVSGSGGGGVRTDTIDLSSIPPADTFELAFDFFRNGSRSVNNGEIQQLIFSQIAPSNEVFWSLNGTGDWNLAQNWSTGQVPNANDAEVVFASIISAPRTVAVDTVVTAKQIRFDSQHSYVVAGNGSIQLEADAGDAALAVEQSRHEFQVAMVLHNNTVVDTSSGTSLIFNNLLDLNGNTLTITGEGSVAMNNRLVTGGGTVLMQSGTMIGNGMVSGNLENVGGTLSPGAPPGILAATGNSVPEPASGLLLAAGLLIVCLRSPTSKRGCAALIVGIDVTATISTGTVDVADDALLLLMRVRSSS